MATPDMQHQPEIVEGMGDAGAEVRQAMEGVGLQFITNMIRELAFTRITKVLSEDPSFDLDESEAVVWLQADTIAAAVMTTHRRVNDELLHTLAGVLMGHSRQANTMAESFARDALALANLGRESGA